VPKRRGPRPAISEEDLLTLIRHDLATSPFTGEGHRKVWARLRIRDGVRVSRKRVLRLMRENHLLSPHRGWPKAVKAHDGKIITMAPNLMWGTDGTRVFTLDEGWVWIFAAVEHWNAECVGWHVCKTGDRYAALQPLSMALDNLYGGVEKGIARGLSLRMDHGTQYLSDHFLNQIKFWGITPSFAFVAEPQTNGVAERFNRTLKEQAIYGRIFRTVEDVREAVKNFVDLYNNEWRVEKNGFRSPNEIRLAA
jgi:transposase InsO family protein